MRPIATSLDGAHLSDVLAYRTAGPAQMLRWATEIAETLAGLHAAGAVHGAVAAENVLIEGGRAVLSPVCRNSGGRTRRDDFLQLGGLLRGMASAFGGSNPRAEVRLSGALDQISREFLQPEWEPRTADMKRVAMALRLLRLDPPAKPAAPPAAPPSDWPSLQLPPLAAKFAFAAAPVPPAPERAQVSSPQPAPPAPQAASPTPLRPAAKMLLLFRVVPPSAAAAPKRKRLPFWRMFWMMVSAASVVTAAGATLYLDIR